MPSPHHSISRSLSKASVPSVPLLLPSDDPDTFLTLMADTLRLSTETLTMAYVYIYRYKRWVSESTSSEPELGVSELLDEHTLSLASLSLATKATESPRRLREFLVPAYTLQHPTSAEPLTFPSPLYDTLRSTLVTAELLLLRVLRFELRVPLPYEYLPRLLEKALTLSEQLASASAEDRLESRVVDLKDTALGRAVWVKVGDVMRSYRICNFFPARAVAAACVFHVAVVERGLQAPGEREVWLKKVTGDRVEYEDFVDALDEIKALNGPHEGWGFTV